MSDSTGLIVLGMIFGGGFALIGNAIGKQIVAAHNARGIEKARAALGRIRRRVSSSRDSTSLHTILDECDRIACALDQLSPIQADGDE